MRSGAVTRTPSLPLQSLLCRGAHLHIWAVLFSKVDSEAKGQPWAKAVLGKMRVLQNRYWGLVPPYIPVLVELASLAGRKWFLNQYWVGAKRWSRWNFNASFMMLGKFDHRCGHVSLWIVSRWVHTINIAKYFLSKWGLVSQLVCQTEYHSPTAS